MGVAEASVVEGVIPVAKNFVVRMPIVSVVGVFTVGETGVAVGAAVVGEAGITVGVAFVGEMDVDALGGEEGECRSRMFKAIEAKEYC